MNKKILIISALVLIAAFGFSQEESDFTDIVTTGSQLLNEALETLTNDDLADGTEEQVVQEQVAEGQDGEEQVAQEQPAEQIVIPQSILNNQYFLRSVRLNEQAKQAFELGDYDASAYYAEQAAEYARLSDEYVTMRLAEYTFERAHSRYTWAESVGAAQRYPSEYRTATTAYNDAVKARSDESWEHCSSSSNRVLVALANVKGRTGETGPNSDTIVVTKKPPSQGVAAKGTLPAQYTVRPWSETGDCFSAIAGRVWAYDDVYQWRKLYEANRDKLPNPNNPNLILPGMVLDIPSIKGETRSGMWDPSKE